MAAPHLPCIRLEAGLPPPSPVAAEHGQQVLAHLRELVAQAPAAGSGERTISFADFMQQVLYAPGLGYTAGATENWVVPATSSLHRNCRRCSGPRLLTLSRRLAIAV